MNETVKKQVVLAIFLLIAVASRFIPHWANFVPLGAIGLFVGARYDYKYALVVLLGTMLISDLFLGFSFASIAVYLGMTGYAAFSFLAKRGWILIGASAVLASTFFFVVSNFGVWLGPWYQHSLSGLVECYTLALPFFKNTLVSDLVFSGALFALYKIYQQNKKGVLSWQKVLLRPILKAK